MRYVRIHYSDGVYAMVEVPNDGKCLFVVEAVWQAYEQHLNQGAAFQLLLQMMDNEQYAREHAND